MRFFHPSRSAEFSARNRLLQESMRPAAPLFAIESEYPIVLSREFPLFSVCCEESELIVAHANLWPRRILGADGNTVAKVGLVGNVATHPNFRGRGVMKSLLDELITRATSQSLDALILWSDLSSFYQKMGFVALGEEFRWHIDRQLLGKEQVQSGHFQFCPAADAGSEIIQSCYALRYKQFPTLERTPGENLMIHKIPAMFLATYFDQSHQLSAFAIMGKGYDMAGVVHEWGALNCESLGALLGQLYDFVKVPEILFLTPSRLESSIQTHLETQKISFSVHPMCLVKHLNPTKSTLLQDLFIWGPDSI